MDGTNGLTENTLGVNVFTAPGKTMVGERPKPFGEALGFDPITSTLIFGEYDAVLVDAMGTVAVVEPEKTAETPLGMTPWSATGKGHDPDDAAQAEAEHWLAFPPSAAECYRAISYDEKDAMTKGLEQKGLLSADDIKERICGDGPDPVPPAMQLLREAHERRMRA